FTPGLLPYACSNPRRRHRETLLRPKLSKQRLTLNDNNTINVSVLTFDKIDNNPMTGLLKKEIENRHRKKLLINK
ncbi:hypothetical protein, partial [Culturomica massiliensis]|uniref:hypothetical protein n=1 Tax=Culturomica massiliensis TaxID=1841857 RepID=UPI002665AAE3